MLGRDGNGTHCFVIADSKKMAALLEEERQIKQENLRLQRKLQMETERREALCRHLSESESSLEMDDERYVLAVIGWCCHWWLASAFGLSLLFNSTLVLTIHLP